MKAAELRAVVDALPTPLSADPVVPPAGSTTIRSTRCECTGRRPSAGFCPACNFVADWVPAEYAAAIVALANHAPALVALLEACEQLLICGGSHIETTLALHDILQALAAVQAIGSDNTDEKG